MAMRAWVASFFAAVLLLVGGPHAHAWCPMRTDSGPITPTQGCPTTGAIMSWRRPCMAYAIDARGTPTMTLDQVSAVIARSFEPWQNASCSGGTPSFRVRELVDFSLCKKPTYNPTGRNVNSIAFQDNWHTDESLKEAFALTTVWHDTETGEIFDVDMEINEKLGPYGVCLLPEGCAGPLVCGADNKCRCSPPKDGMPVDLQNVITHEAGHFFGMGHSSDQQASMFGMACPGDINKRKLNSDDVTGICSLYPPKTSLGQCSFEPKGGLQLDCETPAKAEGCGCSVPGGRSRGKALPIAAGAAVFLLALGMRARRRVRPRPRF